MLTLISIILIYVFAYHCNENSKTFMGASQSALGMLALGSIIGIWIYRISIIWSFWRYDWWIPIVVYLIAPTIGGLTAPLFQRNILGNVISPYMVILFSILTIIGLW